MKFATFLIITFLLNTSGRMLLSVLPDVYCFLLCICFLFRRSHQICSIESLKNLQNSKENTCVKISFSIKLQTHARNCIKKETPSKVFFSNFFKKISYREHLQVTASMLLDIGKKDSVFPARKDRRFPLIYCTY